MGKYKERKHGKVGKNGKKIDTRRNFSESKMRETEEFMEKEGLKVPIIKSMSGKVNGTNMHLRTYGEDQIVAFRNPRQNVHGKSLETAHLMRDVNKLAHVEYRDPERRAEWEARYAEALANGETRMMCLWDYVRSVIRAGLLAAKKKD